MTDTIADNLVVTLHYTLSNEDGQLLDSSEGADPLQYLHGSGNILPALEAALTGKKAGEKVEVVITPDDGYGEVMDELIDKVPREMFQGVDDIQAGMMFQTQTPEGQVQMVTVAAVDEEFVTVDANHPLAGKTVTYNATVESVRAATAEEIEHGHVH